MRTRSQRKRITPIRFRDGSQERLPHDFRREVCDAMLRQSTVAVFWGFTAYAFIARSLLQKLRTRDTGIRGVARDRGLTARVAGCARTTGRFVPGFWRLRR
jgi:hypothetical protein